MKFEELIERGLVMIGSPRTVSQQIIEHQRRLDLFALAGVFKFGAMPYDMMVASMRRFSADVMPRVRLGAGDIVIVDENDAVKSDSQLLGQRLGRVVAPGAVLLQRPNRDPIEVAAEQPSQPPGLGPAVLRRLKRRRPRIGGGLGSPLGMPGGWRDSQNGPI
jgi:hypothetical protein